MKVSNYFTILLISFQFHQTYAGSCGSIIPNDSPKSFLCKSSYINMSDQYLTITSKLLEGGYHEYTFESKRDGKSYSYIIRDDGIERVIAAGYKVKATCDNNILRMHETYSLPEFSGTGLTEYGRLWSTGNLIHHSSSTPVGNVDDWEICTPL